MAHRILEISQAIRLSGDLTRRDKAGADYRLVPFTVPDDTERLRVDFSYAGLAPASNQGPRDNVLDIGLFDPRGGDFLAGEGFRGWSGSERSTFQVGEFDATPGYLPGPIYAGEWAILLGLCKIAPGGCHYEISVALDLCAERSSIANDLLPPPELQRSNERRWYPGDFHTHTHHSDGRGSVADLVADARDRGLRFVAVTEHNTSSHLPGAQSTQILKKNEFQGILLGANILNFPYRWQAVEAAHRMGCGGVAMNPLAGGLIPQHADQFAFLCRDHETPVEAALAFLIGCPQITVTLNGFTTTEHIDTACKVADTAPPLTPADIERVKNHIGQNMNEICTGCGYCLPYCPQSIPIASYLLVYNNKHLFGKTDEQMLQILPSENKYGILGGPHPKAGQCTECGLCEGKCTQHLNIIQRLKDIARWEQQQQEQPQEN